MDAATVRVIRELRATELLIVRGVAFMLPISFSIWRTAFFTRSISGHEIGLVVMSTWLFGETTDLYLLFSAGVIERSDAVFRVLRMAGFSVLALILTAALVNFLKTRFLGERVYFFSRSAILALLALSYFAVTAIFVVTNVANLRNPNLFYISVGAAFLIMGALTLYAFGVFRKFYENLAMGASEELSPAHAHAPDSFRGEIHTHLGEILNYVEMLDSRLTDVNLARTRIRHSALNLRRYFRALEKHPTQRLQTPALKPQKPGTRILIVEGRALQKLLLTNYLQSVCTHPVDLVDTGSAALKSIKASYYGLAILDLNTADVSGLEVARNLRESGFDGSIIGIAASGYDLRADAHAAGINVHLESPVTREEILLHVQQQLSQA
jgi:CheY-like chemotaxis protein